MNTIECNDIVKEFCNDLCENYNDPNIKFTAQDEGISLSDTKLSSNLYLTSGKRINKSWSIDSFKKLVAALIKSGVFVPGDSHPTGSFGLNIQCTNYSLINFCKSFCIYYNELKIKTVGGKEFDPEDEVIFDPEDEVIFDPEDEVIFDAREIFCPADGEIYNDINEPLFDSYGNKIYKEKSLDAIMKILCYLLRTQDYFAVSEPDTNILFD